MSERTFIVFIDYSKAFDSVSHIQMFDILNDMGFPRHIVALIQALYEKQSAIVRWNGAHTKPFFIEKGVRQGCILFSIPTALLFLHHKLDLTTFILYLSKITSNLPENYLSRSKTTC